MFPSIRGKTQSSDQLAKLLKQNDIDWMPHRFRTSFRTGAPKPGSPEK